VENYARNFKAGEVLFREGDPGNKAYVLQSGRVRLTKRVFRSDVIVEELGKGDFCGELALVMKTTRPTSAVVMEDATMLVLPADQFDEMVEQNPAISVQMLRRMATRITRIQFRLSNFALRSPMARMLHQLRAEWKVAKIKGADGTALVPDDLAESLGLEPSEAEEILSKGVKDKLLTVEDGVFKIVNNDSYDKFLSYLELRDRFEFLDR
jgi:CRP-like cAMP-binding protein